MAFLVGSTAPSLQRLAVPFASLLIAVLGYGSQWLFATSPELEPGPLTPTQSRIFNTLLACLWWTYWRACTVDPGRYEFPRSSSKKEDGEQKAKAEKKIKKDGDATTHSSEEERDDDDDDDDDETNDNGTGNRAGEYGDIRRRDALKDDRLRAAARRRWCRKCAAPKPPRAHHCKSCGRCVPKMDHHCPWTGNCVSLQTFPHFARFILYTNLSLWTLGHFLLARFRALWASRDLPAYLGPTLGQLGALAVLALTAGLTALALGILLVTTARGWLFNTTMIEGWEIERHEAVLQRGGHGDDDDEDWWRTAEGDADAAPRSMVDPVEFPYDVGIYANMVQAMGTTNPLYWLLPFAGGPRVARPPSGITFEDIVARLGGDGGMRGTAAALGVGWSYEENGLNDREGMWPPVDPDKVRNARLWRQRRREEQKYRREQMLGLRNPALPATGLSPEEEKEAFRRRQELDLRRWRGRMMDELEEVSPGPARRHGDGYAGPLHRSTVPDQQRRRDIAVGEGRSGWVNADGEHLGDYGVDEDAEFDDEDYVYDDGPRPGAGGEGEGSGRVAGRDAYTPQLIDADDEEVPLAELIRRRKVRTKDGEDT